VRVPDRPATASGPGRLLIAVYVVFAVSAGARAAVQIGTRFGAAPVAYLLSAVASAVYVVAAVGLARRGGASRRLAYGAVGFELAGVLAVGAATLAQPDLFGDETVWWQLGRGYGYVPLVLPVLGLLWLRRTAPGG
jgi:hypothetical protein